MVEKPSVESVLTQDIREVLFSEQVIQKRVAELGEQISLDYSGKDLIMIGVLKGVFLFMADLLRRITIPVEVDFMAISSYSADARSRGLVRLVKDLDLSITGRNLIFVEDVIDTGLTLNYLLQNLQSRQPTSLEVCVLFNKPRNRLIDLPIRYRGFDLPNRFVVGYGLDFHEKYRNLPFVGLLKTEVLKPIK